MKKRSLVVAVLLSACFSVLSCREKILTEMGNSSTGMETAPVQNALERTASSDSGDDKSILPFVAIPQGKAIIQVLNSNLDLDSMDEQILILRDKEKTDTNIRIAVVDFDTVQNKYVIAWQSDTLATNVRTFSVSLIDLIGDHILEVLCSGSNAKGEQTLDVFRKTRAPEGGGIYFQSIFSLNLAGSISVEEEPRSAAYQSGNKSGKSFPIVTISKDAESRNAFDLEKTTYYWKVNDNRYLKLSSEKIPGKETEDKALAELFQKDEQGFEAFLDGPWVLSTASKDQTAILHFDRMSRQITFFTGNVQEVYSWINSYRMLSDGIQLNGVNDLVPYMRNQILLKVEALDRIAVTISDVNSENGSKSLNGQWSGKYFKLTSQMQKGIIRGSNEGTARKIIDFQGFYRSDTGGELTLTAPLFSLKENKKEINGGFAYYDVGKTSIMMLKVFDQFGIVTEIRTYRYEFTETKRENEIIRTLVLVPGILGVNGFQQTDYSYLRFEQIETIEKN
jgi:hypothetical protein